MNTSVIEVFTTSGEVELFLKEFERIFIYHECRKS